MSPHLHVPGADHPKVMVAPPRLNLRRAKSYNAQDRGPLSASTSRFNFNHLLFSPPPSPSLPSLVPRPKRTGSDLLKTRPTRIFRYGLFATLVFSALYAVLLVSRNWEYVPSLWSHLSDEDRLVMVEQYHVPDFATPVIIRDGSGRSRWTVSIPHTYPFPMSTEEYAAMGSRCREVSAQARDLHHQTPISDKTIMSYDAPDDHFVDSDQAEKLGLLPASPVRTRSRGGSGNFVGLDDARAAAMPVCETSMTYVLESTDAGMGNNLMLLWMFYGIAKDEGRAFFIDDSRWAYGDYTEIFQPPAVPACRPPPRHHIVPCPFQARHLVVSGMTAKDILPPMVAKYQRKAGAGNKTQDIWNLAHTGYEDLFRLNAQDAAYVDTRVRDLRNRSKKGITAPDAPVIGMHVRRGDQHPLEYQYRETYIPAEVFHASAQRLSETILSSASIKTESHWRRNEPITVLASDDPTVQDQPDFATTIPAQQRIRLASKDSMQQAKQEQRFIHRFAEEAFGWEGGFFAAMFWNLGVERTNNAANAPVGVDVGEVNEAARHLAPASKQTLQLRSFVGRAYVMDLAVLARATDGVVCAVSAMGCRLLGVMMPWEKGVGGHGWVNVDGDYGWTSVNW